MPQPCEGALLQPGAAPQLQQKLGHDAPPLAQLLPAWQLPLALSHARLWPGAHYAVLSKP